MDLKDYVTNDFIYTALLGFAVFLALISFNKRYYGKKLPPGPIGLPFIGYLPFITRKPHIKFQQLKEKYGSVFGLQVGSRYIVVLADYKAIKEAFSQDAFFGRPPDSVFDLNKITKDSGAINGIHWKEQRRFVIHTLRDLGFVKDTMESHIREEIYELLERLSKEMNEPLTINKYLAPSMSNNISSLVFGKRRHFEDPKRIMLDQILKQIGQNIGQTAWQGFFPWIRAIAKFCGFHNGLSTALERNKVYIREEVSEHEKSINENNLRDFIDYYLLEMQKREKEVNTKFLRPVMVDIVGGLFGAGSETVRITVDWLIFVSVAFPNVQKRVKEEINKIIGQDRFPSKNDIKQMPYTEAVISELLRWRTIVPLNVLRYTLQDTELGPYFIPKGSYVLANLWGVQHDPELWGNDVDDFKPERFLSKDERTVHKPEYFIPFSTGKRQCPGEPLALLEVFLYYTAILQKFDISLPEGAELNFEGDLSLSLQAKPYKVWLKNT